MQTLKRRHLSPQSMEKLDVRENCAGCGLCRDVCSVKCIERLEPIRSTDA